MVFGVGGSTGCQRPVGLVLKINPEIGSSRREPRISQQGEIDKQEMSLDSYETLTCSENRLAPRRRTAVQNLGIQVSMRKAAVAVLQVLHPHRAGVPETGWRRRVVAHESENIAQAHKSQDAHHHASGPFCPCDRERTRE